MRKSETKPPIPAAPFWVLLIAGLLALTVAGCSSAAGDGSAPGEKVLVLGIDGMDPQLLDGFMAEGKMPNFQRLAEQGGYSRLTTSIPPQSPVAWSSIITGLNPGGTGVFDFIHRDPKTMLPYLSTSLVEPPKTTVTVGDWVIPLSSGKATLLRHGKSFWENLSDHGVPATVFRMPANFPPVETEARTLAGMGTPDMLGTYGTFSFYTDEPFYQADAVAGGRIYRVAVEDERVRAQIVGPPNTLRKDQAPVTADFTVWMDPREAVAKIDLQGQEFVLQEGEWSDWVEVEFEIVPYLQSVSGICRFYLKRVRPEFQLYVSPVNIDPADPALPLSTPEEYAPELAEAIGRFHTLGIAEDTKALTAGVLNESEYLAQADTVFEEQYRVLRYELDRFESGLLFIYFSALDQNAHMFWREMDSERARNRATTAPGEFAALLEQDYMRMDRVLGEVMEELDDRTTLLVLSDHGFAPYRRSFNLNNWLADNGYLHMKEGVVGAQANLFAGADWERTRAYGLGLNGLYLNLAGREQEGIVQPGAEAEELMEELEEGLLAVEDPAGGERVITRVDRAADVYEGEYAGEAPDLLIGYNRGYRAGWQTILGEFAWEVLEDNTEPWSGDHCMDFRQVPGVLLSNRRITADAPSLLDIAPSILAVFGVDQSPGMTGKSVLAAADD